MKRIIAAPVISAALRAPADRRAWSELAYCAAVLPLSVAGFVLAVVLLVPGLVLCVTVVGIVAGLALLVAATRLGRLLGPAHRRLAGRLLTERWPGELTAAPLPFRPGHGILGRTDARLRDSVGWRAVGYVLLKLPLAVTGCYLAAVTWIGGVFYLTYPVWWGIARGLGDGHSPRHYPVPGRRRADHTLGPAAFALPLLGIALLLAAPWTIRLVVTADRWLIRNLLCAPPLAERVRELEESRALAVDASAATLRRVERDLHDGAQVRLVALALSLGMAREKLGDEGRAGQRGPGPRAGGQRAPQREGGADRAARPGPRHPPAGARQRPAGRAGHPDRAQRHPRPGCRPTSPAGPRPAIETIAYFCAAELLANVAKHSGASHAPGRGHGPGRHAGLTVSDDGVGGARPGSWQRPGRAGAAGRARWTAARDRAARRAARRWSPSSSR